jgi:hypothetical protein
VNTITNLYTEHGPARRRSHSQGHREGKSKGHHAAP